MDFTKQDFSVLSSTGHRFCILYFRELASLTNGSTPFVALDREYRIYRRNTELRRAFCSGRWGNKNSRAISPADFVTYNVGVTRFELATS